MKAAKRQRGAVSKDKSSSKAILVYFPHELMPLLDRAVNLTDSDRSKFIRNSVREKIAHLEGTAA